MAKEKGKPNEPTSPKGDSGATSDEPQPKKPRKGAEGGDAAAAPGKPDKPAKGEKPEKAEKGEKPEKAERPAAAPAATASSPDSASADAGAEGATAEAPKRKKKIPRSGFQSDGKKIVNARKQVDPHKKYELGAAIELLLKVAPPRKFDETIELVMKLGLDPKKQGQALRGSLSLPKGVGKVNRVVAFAEGPAADDAKKAGAVEVGGEDLAKKILDGWDDFDIAIAHPAAMKYLSKLGKVLGPKGKMPTPKAGTVTTDVGPAVKEFAAGKIEYRTDDNGNVHVPVGKRSFGKDSLIANIEAFVEHIKAIKPGDSKGQYIQKVFISSTMGPGVGVEIKGATVPAV